jgi:hypothetical protein
MSNLQILQDAFMSDILWIATTILGAWALKVIVEYFWD